MNLRKMNLLLIFISHLRRSHLQANGDFTHIVQTAEGMKFTTSNHIGDIGVLISSLGHVTLRDTMLLVELSQG